MSEPDLFTYRPKQEIDVEAARAHARECYRRLVGRYPMTRAEKDELRRQQIEQRRQAYE